MDRYCLRQGLPVIADGPDIYVGLTPPYGILIEDAPGYLAPLLAHASELRTPAELQAHARDLGLSAEDAQDLVAELIGSAILTTERVDRSARYSRHDLYYALAHEGSASRSDVLATSRVGLVGVGGIGTNVATQLIAAGVGYLRLFDGDIVEPSNMTRQFLFDEADFGRLKVEAAREHLLAKNSAAQVVADTGRADGVESLMRLFADVDVVIVSADTPQLIADWANQASLRTMTPFTCAGYQDTRGLVGPMILPGDGPCLACAAASDGVGAAQARVDGRIADIVNLNAAYQAPSFGPLNAMVASAAVSDVLRLLMGLRPRTAGRRLVLDSLTFESSFESYAAAPDCLACAPRAA
ncbi:MAG: ThiF family adenylyltransferase [Tetrasphaera sp.]